MSRLFAIIRSVALIGARRPFLALAISLVVVAISGALIPGLKISTSRRDLVSAKHPNQKKTIEFDEKFGYPNAPAIVVSGGSVEDRRKVVDALEVELEKLPNFENRVIARVRPQDVAEVFLVSDPNAIAKAIPDAGDPKDDPDGKKKQKRIDQLEGGFAGWIALLQNQLQAGVDAADDEDAKPTKQPDPKETAEGLERLGTMFAAMDDELAGKSALDRLGDMKSKGDVGRGFDDLGYLSGDQNHHIVAMFPPLKGDEGYEVRPVVRQIREARDRALEQAKVDGVTADVTGLPALVTDELAMIERDLAVTSIASSIALFLTLFWAFRSFRQSLVSFLPLGFGTIVTFGIVQLVLGKLNLVTASFTSVLLGLGDFGVHIQSRYSELLRQGEPPKRAMETAMLKAGPGLVVGTVTTAVAFLTTLVTEFTAFAELGFITSLGLIVMLAGTYLLVPAAVLLLLGKKPRPSPELPGFRQLASLVRRRPRTIIAVALVLSAFTAVFVPRVRFNGRYFDFLPASTESARGLRALESDAVVSPFVANVRAKNLEQAREYAEKLRQLDTVASVETPSDLLPALDEDRLTSLRKIVKNLEKADGSPVDFASVSEKPVDRAEFVKQLGELRSTLDDVAYSLRNAGPTFEPAAAAADKLKEQVSALRTRVENSSQARLDELQHLAFSMLARALVVARDVAARGSYGPDDLPPMFRHRFVSKDSTEFALFVHPKGDVWEVPVAEAFTRDVTSIAPETSGIATTLAEHPKMIVRGFERATILSLVLVLVILGIGFRRVSDVLIAAMPLLLGSLWMIGSMPLLNLQFNHANMVVLPLLLGLGVEASGHIMHRYKESAAEHGGKAKLDEILASTGSAVFVAALTTVWGFSVMMLGKYRAMVGLGMVMTIGMLGVIALSLIVLPAVLIVLRRAE